MRARRVTHGVLLLAVALTAASGCRVERRLVHPAPSTRRALGTVGLAQETLYGRGDVARAARLAREALAEDQHLAGAHEVLAHLAWLADDADGAFEHWLRALADARSPHVELYLSRVAVDQLRRPQLLALVRLLVQVAREHPDPFARDAARRHLTPLAVRLGAGDLAAGALAERVAVTRFFAIAGFDNAEEKGFDTVYPPEAELDLEKRYLGQRGMVGWRAVAHRGPLAELDLRSLFYPFDSNVAYLWSSIASPRPQRLLLQVVTSGPVQVWINDRSLLATRQVRAAGRLGFHVPVQLQRGHNKLLVKSCHQSGAWHLSVGFVTADGQRPELTPELQPRRYRKDRGPPLRFTPRSVHQPALGGMRSGARRSYWEAVALAGAGLRRVAIGHLERHLVRWPHSVGAIALATALNRDDGQLQRATSLVDRAMSLLRSSPAHATRFVIRRSSLYRQRGQIDRALATIRDHLAMARTEVGVDLAREIDQLYLSKGWHIDRCREARKLHRRRPDWAWTADVLASCNDALGRTTQAAEWLARAVELAPSDRSFRGRLAGQLRKLGRCRAAVAVQRETVRRWPANLPEQQQLGDLLRGCGRADEALAAYRESAALAPRWDRPHREEGLLHFERGDVAQALAAWERALQRNPDDAELWDRVTHLKPERDPILERHRPKEAGIAAAIARGQRVVAARGASVIWILDDEVAHLMPDGTLKRVVTLIRRAADRAGRDALGEMRLPRRGLVKVLDAYSLDSSGQRHEVTSMHGRTVRYPTLDEGAVVVLQYHHVTQPEGYLRHHLAATWFFQQALGHVVRARWLLAVPADRELKAEPRGGQVQHRVRREGGLALHTFVAENVPPLNPEQRSLPTGELLRAVTVSTVPSWNYFSSWGRSLTADVFELDPAMEALVERLVADARTAPEKIRRVYHHVVKHVRYQQDYETVIAGVKPHPAAVVLARGYGDCKDKSVLIIALLRRLGVEAHLALVRTRGAGRVIADVPSQQFNHAVVYLPPQAGVPEGRFLDATAETLDLDVLRGDVQGTLALVLFPRQHRLVEVPYQPPATNRAELAVDLDLASDGAASATVELKMRGHRAGALRKVLQNRELLQQYAQSLVNRLYPDSALVGVEVDGDKTVLGPLVVRIEARAGAAGRREEQSLRLRPPELLGEGAAMAPWTERRHPVFFGPPAMLVSRLSVKLPAGYRIQTRPQDLVLDAPCLELEGRWSSSPGGDATARLRYDQRVVRSCAVLAVSDYEAFRAAVNRLKRSLEEDLVLVTQDRAGPRARRPPGAGSATRSRTSHR